MKSKIYYVEKGDSNKLTTFKELNLSEPILKSLDTMGFEEATPIQAETIPLAMKGEDVIGQAQTGTGKTAAFGIPMLEKFNRNEKGTKGLVVAPTRELAIQVAAEIDRLGRNKGLKHLQFMVDNRWVDKFVR